MNIVPATVRAVLADLPQTCRFHGSDFERLGMQWGYPRCDSCRQPWRVVRALAEIAEIDSAPPSDEWENGFSEAWNAIARHHGSREERDLADLLRDYMTTDDGVGQRYVRADDDMFVDAARQVLEAGWFRTECCRFCAPSAREHDTDEGHTHGESCCLYLPAQDQAAARKRIATLSWLLRGMARRVGQWRETASLLDDPDAVSAISEGQMAVEAGETFTLGGRPAPRPARRTIPFAASRGPRVFSDGGC